MRNSRIFSKCDNRRKTRTTGTELELKDLNSPCYCLLSGTNFQKWLNCLIHSPINFLTFPKFFNFFWCFYHSENLYWTLLHHELWPISFYLFSKCLREIVWISKELLIFSQCFSPSLSGCNNLKSSTIEKSTCSWIAQYDSFIVHYSFVILH